MCTLALPTPILQLVCMVCMFAPRLSTAVVLSPLRSARRCLLSCRCHCLQQSIACLLHHLGRSVRGLQGLHQQHQQVGVSLQRRFNSDLSWVHSLCKAAPTLLL